MYLLTVKRSRNLTVYTLVDQTYGIAPIQGIFWFIINILMADVDLRKGRCRANTMFGF